MNRFEQTDQLLIDQEVDPTERIIWRDKPVPKYFTKGSISIFLFAIPWTAFSIFWICGASGFSIPDFSEPEQLFPLFGVPFLLVGIGMLSTPLLTYRTMQRTLYVITDRRAIIFEKKFSQNISTFENIDKNNVLRKQKGELGDLIFDHKHQNDGYGGKVTHEIGFINIRNLKKVYEAFVDNVVKKNA